MLCNQIKTITRKVIAFIMLAGLPALLWGGLTSMIVDPTAGKIVGLIFFFIGLDALLNKRYLPHAK